MGKSGKNLVLWQIPIDDVLAYRLVALNFSAAPQVKNGWEKCILPWKNLFDAKYASTRFFISTPSFLILFLRYRILSPKIDLKFQDQNPHDQPGSEMLQCKNHKSLESSGTRRKQTVGLCSTNITNLKRRNISGVRLSKKKQKKLLNRLFA